MAGAEFDDNANLSIRTDEELELSGYLLDARADIYYLTPATSFFVAPRVLLRNYPDNSEFDSTDMFLRSRFRHDGRSNTFAFRVNYDYQTVRTAERSNSDLEIDDPNEIPNDDSGRVGLLGKRAKWRFAPSWDFKLSNKSTIGASINYTASRYDDVFAGLLNDYTDTRLNVNYRNSFSGNTTGVLRATGRRFETTGSPNDITGYGILGGFDRALSSQTQLTALIGVEYTEESVGESTPTPIANLTLTRNLETITMLAQYLREVTASGASVLSVRDTININFRRRLSEKISAGLGVRAYKTAGIGGSASIDDRNYVQLQTRFSWFLSTSFVVEADYRYTIMDRSESIGERSNSNHVTLWLVYQPNTIPKI